jgi:cystathionine beta-synthase
MTVYESVIDAIGNTPLFRLGRMTDDTRTPIYVKAEFFNIGGSVKDRAALSMVRQAERDGLLQPGGTIVEGTSGNTGIGLAVIARQRGYRIIVGVPDKSAKEKVDILKAYGAEVVIAKTTLPREDPDHLFNVVRQLAENIPGAWFANQYDNPANPDAHRRTTGPEIWEQTKGKITHLVVGVGTGGTVTGTGEFLHQISNGRVTVVGADPEASVYSGGDGSPYYVESIGHYLHPGTLEDVWPESLHPGVIDRFERIGDRESLLTARRLAREEGLLAGSSSGTAVAAALRVARDLGPDDLVVAVLPDSGRSYLSKTFSDDWLRRWGFLDEPMERSVYGELGEATVHSVLQHDRADLVTVDADVTVGEALASVADIDRYPQVPVVLARKERPYGISASEVVGSIDLTRIAAAVAQGVDTATPLSGYLQDPLPSVGIGEPISVVLERLGQTHRAAVLLIDGRAAAMVSRDHLLPRSPA